MNSQQGQQPPGSNTPLVSVCVPTFQHEDFIAECLESIISQKTDFPFEILVGEDASTDKTREIVTEFAEKYPMKIRLFLRKEEEKAIMYGRRAGRFNHLGLYKDALGKYICICDGDDYWLDPYKLQKQVELLEENGDCSICITNTVLDQQPGKKPPGVPEGFKIFNKGDLKKSFYMGHISSWMIRNRMDELLKNPIVQKPIPLDQVLFSFYKKKGNLIYLPDTTSFYRYNPNGLYLSKSKKKNHQAQLRNNWFLFRYIHHDPVLFTRSVVYSLKRFYANFLLK
ncbi:glycosyltransferase family 2 protein [Algoriphagus vanfongensis]|uniref:glycosyltransferase family 2 protein n=1 Tax=Algoriphagus vanfongensis TaxID=426371 RepID=UPI00040009E5|nr:glycosyltransferase [Algoriphagus vanfongensis]